MDAAGFIGSSAEKRENSLDLSEISRGFVEETNRAEYLNLFKYSGTEVNDRSLTIMLALNLSNFRDASVY